MGCVCIAVKAGRVSQRKDVHVKPLVYLQDR